MEQYGDITKISGYTAPIVDIITGEYKVYKYTFPNGMIYIGMTKNDIKTRRSQGYQHNAGLKCAIKEAGWSSVKVEILCEGLSREEAEKWERRNISKYNAQNPQVGYNVSGGGKSTFYGLKHTAEYKAHMSSLNKGKQYSEQTLERMRSAHQKERKRVVQKSQEGGLIKVYESIGKAAQEIKGYKTNISRACAENKMYKGYKWEFESEVMTGETPR